MYIIKESNASYNAKKKYNVMERRAVCLLSRRYDLTNTGYKFLEIGINVGPPSYVEIALGDHYMNCRCLSKRGRPLRTAMKYLQDASNEYKDNFTSVGQFHR
ncbi:hypothetical protein G5I_13528 [Acromyrmex echinatior]|uniref:Uncharacterized protein n=1 Tax=Acromyrmex echinatior TaxID=103372 RepID=F4X5A0_ACREC|nr:hypothetical protein G5I_13528 [Acromyrmex echinatior]